MLTTEEHVEQQEHETETTTTVAEHDTEPLIDPHVDAFQIELIAVDDIFGPGGRQNESLANALADSIAHIGLQNPICVVKNDIAGQPAPYRIVSGRKRLAAFVKLKRKTIPCHVLRFVPEDPHADLRKQLAEHEENLVREQLPLLELCEYLGKSKAIYEELYPETKHGGAPKKPGKDLGTRSLPYVLSEARQLGKSRATIGKFLKIYKDLIVPNHLARLKGIEHPILHRVEDLVELAKCKDDIPALVKILYQYNVKNDGKFHIRNDGKFCSLQDAKKQWQRSKEAEALQKAQEAQRANTTKSQESDTTASPGEPTVDQTSTQDSSTDSPAMSTPQPPDATTTPPPNAALVATQNSETPVWDTSSGEELTTVEDVLRALDEQINTYLRAKNLFIVFHIEIGKTSNEIRVLVRERP
jgi:ParB family chromosome partitioning protein